MLQIRVSLPDFSNGVNFTDSIILERADNISLKKAVNSSEESISFTLSTTDPKLSYVTYLRWWECWDTDTNARLNFGPIRQISKNSGDAQQVSGPGRSALLLDYYKSIQTFYTPIDVFLEELRYENLVSEPKTSTIIDKTSTSDYYGLSLRTKDFAIDEQTGYIAIGRDTPERGTIKVSEYWSGVDKADYLIVDLGESVTISKFNILFPWWGGATLNNERLYSWDLYYSNDNVSYTLANSVTSANLLVSDPRIDGIALYFGDTGYAVSQLTPSGSPITARYWKIDITNTFAPYGNFYAGTLSEQWDWECGKSNVLIGVSTPSPTVSEGDLIPKDKLSPSSDCHAAIIEIGIKRKILGTDTITNLSYHQIQNDNRQVEYYHIVQASEMISTSSATVKKFEPGTFFRKFSFAGTGVTIKDEYNTEIYMGDGADVDAPAYCRMLKLSGDAAVQIIDVDAWRGKLDAFSFGGSYSYSKVSGDYFTLDFRGVSVKWYATIPTGSTAANVQIEIRSKTGTGWSSWSTLEASYALPVGVSAEKVWEITYESGTLVNDTSYQIKVTNLNGGYVSVDAFAGYWAGTMSTINEDDALTKIRDQRFITQLYDGKFLNGSINKFNNPTSYEIMEGIVFTGDRFIVYSRKLPGAGTLKIGLYKWPEYEVVNIPGGLGDGTINLDLNSPTDIPQAVIFDSKDYFTDAQALLWRGYGVGIYTASGTDLSDTWTQIWASTALPNPVGTWYDPSDPGFVRVIDETSRKLYKINQKTRAATSLSGALFSGYAGGLSGDPADGAVYWALEAPWLSGSGNNTKIHKIRKSDNVILNTYNMGSAIKFSAIKVSAAFVWCTRYDGTTSLYKISKTTGGVISTYVIVYGAVSQTKGSGVSVNGTDLMLWYEGQTRALICSESDPTTITRTISTAKISALGGDWTTEGTDQYLYMDSLFSDHVWKYRITASTYKPIWLDGFSIHQTNGLSVKFLNSSYLDILKSTSEALQMEWDVTESGIKVVPRLGVDTNVIMAEGRGTTIKIQDIEDAEKVATQLILTGADIDGLPLSGVVENRQTKQLLGRTIQRIYDLRNVSDQFTLIGAGRTELMRRRAPERRVTIERVGTLDVSLGDSFIAKTSSLETRVRANTITRNQSTSNGTTWTVECIEWPVIV